MLGYRQLLNEEFQGEEAPSGQRIGREIRRLVDEMAGNGCPGRRGAEQLSLAYDLLIQEAYSHYYAEGSQPVAVMATGGYGRRELAPGSDIDVLFLTGGEPEEKHPVTGSILGLLWNTAEEAGHKTLGLGDVAGCMAAHIETATSFIDARFICGEPELHREMMGTVSRYFRKNSGTFIPAKTEEAAARHARQGGTVFRQQPDIKEAPGGLRDIQTIRWIGKALEHAGGGKATSPHPLISTEDVEAMESGLDFIMSIRLALHYLTGGREDILRIDLQPETAELAGYEASAEMSASQVMMREYYRHAGAVHRALRVVMNSYGRIGSTAKKRQVEHRRKLAGRPFTIVGKALYAATPAVFDGADGGMEILEAFEEAQKHRVEISEELIKRIHDSLYRVDERFREDNRSAEAFMRILSATGNVAPALRAMRDSGFLAAYLPPLASMEGLVPNDVLHEYTVDEHTLFTIEAVDGLFTAGGDEEANKRHVLEGLPRPEVLMLALLVHDAGKGKGGAHSERGAVAVPQITEQLRLPEQVARQVMFLVSNHLLMEEIARIRDTNDEKILLELAETAGSVEMLDYLYLMTYADVSSLGRGGWPAWKDTILNELYHKVKILILEGRTPAREEKDFRRALLEALPEKVSEAAALQHLELVPPRYKLEVTVEEALEHLRLIEEMSTAKEGAAAMYKVADGHGEIWVVSPDKTGLVAEVAGSISASGLDIQSAVAYTRKDGIVLDKFLATVPEDSLMASPWETARANILSVLGGRASVRELMEQRGQLQAVQPKRTGSGTSGASVTVDNRISDRYTVVDVVCPDRQGLLYDLTTAILSKGMDIHFARITTRGETAMDVFYITESGGGKLKEETDMSSLRDVIEAAAKEKET
ncbi:MAG: [protein-PII] uridylyltransferase [Planctomycetes bacterium]|nr:[protein-PII] uridylyltransferase [Planctomycetota bacterium]